ncbi:MAG: transcription termination/antitermination NusG family protein [Bacteroides sp.]
MNTLNDWYIALVTPNTEKECVKKVKTLVGVKDMDEPYSADNRVNAYVPVQRELHEWPSIKKRKWVDRVLCPCYLFIQCSEEDRYDLACRAKFILRFLTDRARTDETGIRRFARIPHSQMENFMRMIGDAKNPITIDPSQLHKGTKVRVKTGLMAGIEGYISREPNGSVNLAINIDYLGCAKMEFPIEDLDIVEE